VLEDYRDKLKADGLKPSTVNLRIRTVTYAVQRWAKRTGRSDFTDGFERLRETRTERVPLTDAEMDQIVSACLGDALVDQRDYAIVILTLRTGLRRAGVQALDFASINGPHVTVRLKGGKIHTFTVDEETETALDAWLACLHRAGIHQGAVFRRVAHDNTIGARLSAFQIWDVVRRRSRRAGIRHAFPHLLRHTCVTVLREEGATPLEIRGLTGQSEETIVRTYSHARPTDVPVGARMRPLPRRVTRTDPGGDK
jgi:integrase